MFGCPWLFSTIYDVWLSMVILSCLWWLFVLNSLALPSSLWRLCSVFSTLLAENLYCWRDEFILSYSLFIKLPSWLCRSVQTSCLKHIKSNYFVLLQSAVICFHCYKWTFSFIYEIILLYLCKIRSSCFCLFLLLKQLYDVISVMEPKCTHYTSFIISCTMHSQTSIICHLRKWTTINLLLRLNAIFVHCNSTGSQLQTLTFDLSLMATFVIRYVDRSQPVSMFLFTNACVNLIGCLSVHAISSCSWTGCSQNEATYDCWCVISLGLAF